MFGACYAFVYKIYIKIDHPDVIFASRKNIVGFIQDSFASLVQFEPPRVFKAKATCSSGYIYFIVLSHSVIFQLTLLLYPIMYPIIIQPALPC